ncbi:methyl-accepting chemotaxis protein [Modicisalibacter radicis]|uniref:methyl-accepting chemotaxis protein n=1 Tax=Halomonas sp. EAR18 TaxID=2518972 RepID=UPI00109C4549|nr:methyl-accepting chemotaxis protein [Halomonas sp. EAR18]
MKHLLHRIPISRKFMLALALPVLAMLFFAVTGIVERQRVVANMERLQSLTTLARQAGNLVHEIQRERGMTAGFLGSEGNTFRSELGDQRPATDAQAATLLASLDALDSRLLGTELNAQIDAARQRLDATPGLRRRVDALDVPVGDALSHYTAINAALMNLTGTLSHVTAEASIARRLAAYYNLLEAKDLAGIERALLANAFAADRMPPALHRRFMNLIGEEAAFLEGFDTLATATMHDHYQRALSGPEIDRLAGLRELAIERADRGGFGVDPQQWFDWQTVKIGRLKTVEDAVTEEILTTAQALRSDARIDLWSYVGIAGLASLLTLALTLAIVRAIVGPLRRTLHEVTNRGGDLTQRLAVPGSDELSRLYQAFNAATDDTERLVANIRSSALSIEVASGEIAQGNQDLAQRTEEQSASLVETASSMEQITATVRHTADNAGQAQHLAEDVAGQATQACDVADQARQAMTAIHTANQEVTAIVAAIDGIAFQTNLLALNASVEAARAGEHGRGFAVVASEVRQLASRSASEAERIRALIGRNVTTIDTGSRLVSDTHGTLAEIASRIGQVASLVSDISAAATEQSAGIDQINQAVAQLEEVTQQNAALVEQIAAASKSLDEQAVDMAQEVGQFTVTDTGHAHAALPQPTHRDAVPA